MGLYGCVLTRQRKMKSKKKREKIESEGKKDKRWPVVSESQVHQLGA